MNLSEITFSNLEKFLLYSWGSPDYAETLEQLRELESCAVNRDMVRVISHLRSKLLNRYTWESYSIAYIRLGYVTWIDFPELTNRRPILTDRQPKLNP